MNETTRLERLTRLRDRMLELHTTLNRRGSYRSVQLSDRVYDVELAMAREKRDRRLAGEGI